MPRSLPAVGQPIHIHEILKAFSGRSREAMSLQKWAPGRTFFWMSSGSAALTLCCQALKGSGGRGEVIMPAYTCPSLPAAAIRAGLKPVLCDTEQESFRMNLDQLSSRIGPDTAAIVAVHLLGIPERIVEIREMVRKQNIVLIEDAAQAFGNTIRVEGGRPEASDENKHLGTFGDIGIFSFRRGKPLGLLDGGVILANNKRTEEVVRAKYDSLPADSAPSSFSYLSNLLLYSVFFDPRFYWIPQRMPWLQLGETIFTLEYEMKRMNPRILRLGGCLLPEFGKIRHKRNELASNYRKRLEPMRPEIVFPHDTDDEGIALLRFPVVFKSREKRDRILSELKKRGLGATGSYPVPLNELPGAADYFDRKEVYPNAKYLSERIMTLPLHEYVTERDIERMTTIINKQI
jgi:dTDP-4-amino-4,6-dideoxygalactose transaminase